MVLRTHQRSCIQIKLSLNFRIIKIYFTAAIQYLARFYMILHNDLLIDPLVSACTSNYVIGNFQTCCIFVNLYINKIKVCLPTVSQRLGQLTDILAVDKNIHYVLTTRNVKGSDSLMYCGCRHCAIGCVQIYVFSSGQLISQ